MSSINERDEEEILNRLFKGEKKEIHESEDFKLLDDIISTIHDEGYDKDRKLMEDVRKKVKLRRLKRNIFIAVIGLFLLLASSIAYFNYQKEDPIYASLEGEFDFNRERDGAITLRTETYRGNPIPNLITSDSILIVDLDNYIAALEAIKNDHYTESISALSNINSKEIVDQAEYLSILSLYKLGKKEEVKIRLKLLIEKSPIYSSKIKQNETLSKWLEE